ncbi:MAG: FAD-dependent oxidoreductase [Micromonosporaceae bacterium]|nr:FAD-dependent oxidoreductase [Micromonosporaceae bacterium]
MSGSETFVIIGASLAGAKAAETLRSEGFTGRLVLVGAETSLPYERPPLSKGYLLGTDEVEKAFVHDQAWYTENDVTLMLGVRATAIDPAEHVVTLDRGDPLRYDKLLLATGARPRTVPVPGTDLAGVHYLRSIEESTALRERLSRGPRVVIIGAGWIGLEVAAAARHYRCPVTVVEIDTLPLRRVLGDEMATVYRQLHEAHGVSFRFGTGVSQICGPSDGGGQSERGGSGEGSGAAVTHVVLTDGTEVPADLVVIGVGVVPNVEQAEAAGLAVDSEVGGIVTDEYLRTSDPDIVAAGDCAAVWSPLLQRRIRVEHWANALNGGPAAARTMLGQSSPYDPVPYFYSDQYTTSPLIGMEYAGYVAPGGYDRVVFRGSPEIQPDRDPEFLVFWTRQGRVLAGMNVNIWDVQDQIEPLVRAGHAGVAVDLERLADPSVPLVDLLPPREAA